MLRIVWVKVGQETEVAAVNANNLDVITCQGACGAQHIAVATDHHGEIRLLANFRQRAGSDAFKLQLLGDLLLDLILDQADQGCPSMRKRLTDELARSAVRRELRNAVRGRPRRSAIT